MSDLLAIDVTDEDPAHLVRRFGTVLATFDHRSQDSGNVSWLISTERGDFFVKSAGAPVPAPGTPKPHLDHIDRVRLLRNAVALARSCNHACLAPLRQVIESAWGPVLVYEATRGELVGTTRSRRDDPGSAYQRLAHLPEPRLLAVLDDLLDLHRTLTRSGWVACDLYDGCLLVEFATDRLTVIDLDHYRIGPSTNTMGRMFGSTRFMAPEEFELGAVIDQRTTVYTLARIAWHFGTRLTEQSSQFCGSTSLAAILRRALESDPDDRFASVDAFASAWESAR